MPANLLQDRDYTIIIARSDASKDPQHPWYEDWVEAQASLIDLAKKCQQFDSNGITLYEASTPMWKYKNSNVARLAEILQRQNTELDSANPSAINLEEALKQVLDDDGKISKYEAKVIREIIMADGHVSQEEKDFLEKALRDNNFDESAFELLSGVLLRSHLKD